MWASADQTCLGFLRFNQGQLRATLYSGFEDWMAADDVRNPHDLGRHVLLPSSYIGGPQHQQQQYQDAMAIVHFFKKINLFITFTANPNWSEITCELFPGQTFYDQPDIIACVFKMKKDQLLTTYTSNTSLATLSHMCMSSSSRNTDFHIFISWWFFIRTIDFERLPT